MVTHALKDLSEKDCEQMNISGPWSREIVDHFLTSRRLPIRLSVIAGSGYPIVASHWFIWSNDTLLCGTPATSKITRALGHNPKCGFEVASDAPPYQGVRGQGDVVLSDDAGLKNLRSLVMKYLGHDNSSLAKWLLNREDAENIIIIQPIRMMSWDYSDRMSDALVQGKP